MNFICNTDANLTLYTADGEAFDGVEIECNEKCSFVNGKCPELCGEYCSHTDVTFHFMLGKYNIYNISRMSTTCPTSNIVIKSLNSSCYDTSEFVSLTKI